MCDHKEREAAMTTVAVDAVGKPTVWCDPCLASLVKALNDGGISTVASCCGHGTHVGSVALSDGRWIVVMTAEDWARFDNRRGTVADTKVKAARNVLRDAGYVIPMHLVRAALEAAREATPEVKPGTFTLTVDVDTTGLAEGTPVERFADLAADQFRSDLDYDGAEVKRRILTLAHVSSPDHPHTMTDCPVCTDDEKLDR